MTRVTTMALAAAAMSLSTGSVAHAETVEFNYTWYGYAPGNNDVTEWGMSHITDVSFAPNGDFSGPTGPTLNFYLDIDGELSPVEISNSAPFLLLYTGQEDFEMTMDLVNVPGYGAMHIEIDGSGSIYDQGTWEGEVQITWGGVVALGESDVSVVLLRADMSTPPGASTPCPDTSMDLVAAALEPHLPPGAIDTPTCHNAPMAA